MKTSSCKAKGRRLAEEVKQLLLQHASALKPDDIVVTSSGDTGEDLKLSPLARQHFPFTIECKNQEALNIWKAMEQAIGHSKSNSYIPILCFKRNRLKDVYVSMRLEDFLRCQKK